MICSCGQKMKCNDGERTTVQGKQARWRRWKCPACKVPRQTVEMFLEDLEVVQPKFQRKALRTLQSRISQQRKHRTEECDNEDQVGDGEIRE